MKTIQPQIIKIECPLESSYVFANKCAIKTCKYYTSIVTNQCLLVSGRLDPSFADDGRISDDSLLKWKESLLKETFGEEISIRDIRREYIRAVNQVLVLDRYLRYLDDNLVNLDYPRANSRRVQETSWIQLKDLYPFYIPYLKFNKCHSPYMLIEDCYRTFQEEIEKRVDVPKYENLLEGKKPKMFKTKTSELSISDICFMKRKTWEDLRNKIFVSKTLLF